MSIAQMRTFIDIVRPGITKDADGFSTKTDVVLVSTRAYREGRHGSEKWASRAAFTDSTDLFRFRIIPGVEITTDLAILCDGHRFGITSVENVKGRWMYIEVLCREVKPSG